LKWSSIDSSTSGTQPTFTSAEHHLEPREAVEHPTVDHLGEQLRRVRHRPVDMPISGFCGAGPFRRARRPPWRLETLLARQAHVDRDGHAEPLRLGPERIVVAREVHAADGHAMIVQPFIPICRVRRSSAKRALDPDVRDQRETDQTLRATAQNSWCSQLL